MALFHAYSQSIADSGRPHISRESTKLFQTDKNYKHCKCMYEMLALAKEKLHYLKDIWKCKRHSFTYYTRATDNWGTKMLGQTGVVTINWRIASCV